MKLLHSLYPSLVGFLLGLLQTGLFFQLSFTLSSSFRTFLMITICWLIGSAIGLRIAKQVDLSVDSFVLLGLLAYLLCGILLNLAPFDTELWPVYAFLITLTGLFPGVFFARVSKYYSARQLFFRENNGFIGGLVSGTLLFLILGRVVIWVLPIFMACIVMMCTQIYFRNHNITTLAEERTL